MDADVSVDISTCNVSDECVQAIESAVRQFVDVYLENDSAPLIQNAVVLAHWKAQSYKREHYTDLVDFCTILRQDYDRLPKLATESTPVRATRREMRWSDHCRWEGRVVELCGQGISALPWAVGLLSVVTAAV